MDNGKWIVENGYGKKDIRKWIMKNRKWKIDNEKCFLKLQTG